MGRRRKFKTGEVARWDGQPVVIVDYRQDTKGRGSYRVVRTLGLVGKAYGPLRWVHSHEIERFRQYDRIPWYMRPHVVRQAKANLRLGDEDRGCSCQCCAHVAIPAGEIREDGTLKGEQ